jgi:hypothetical protein
VLRKVYGHKKETNGKVRLFLFIYALIDDAFNSPNSIELDYRIIKTTEGSAVA